MIFKQIDAILSGQKTQTRRVCRLEEHMYLQPKGTRIVTPSYANAEVRIYPNHLVKWRVGRTYAVVPKRGQPTVFWVETTPNEYLTATPSAVTRDAFLHHGWKPLRILLTAIRKERLQDISEADARAEGVDSIEEYRARWESINGKTKGARWDDNPAVWVLTFELADNPHMWVLTVDAS